MPGDRQNGKKKVDKAISLRALDPHYQPDKPYTIPVPLSQLLCHIASYSLGVGKQRTGARTIWLVVNVYTCIV